MFWESQIWYWSLQWAGFQLNKSNDTSISYSEDTVKLDVIVKEFTQKSLLVPVVVNNLPSDLSIRLVPENVTIRFDVAMEDYNNIAAINFLLMCDFDKKNDQTINLIDSSNINGILKKQTKSNMFKPENDIPNNYWFTLNREDVFKYTGKNFSPYIIYLSGQNDLPKTKSITANISNNHKKYALTWFSLAISILLIYLYLRKKNY